MDDLALVCPFYLISLVYDKSAVVFSDEDSFISQWMAVFTLAARKIKAKKVNNSVVINILN